MQTTETVEITPFCDLHVDIWDKLDGVVSHKSWAVEAKFLAYDQILWSCGIGTGALCLLLQDGPSRISNGEELDVLIQRVREIKTRAPLLAEHVIHLRVEFLDSDARNSAIRLVEKHSDIIKLVSLIDHIPGYRQYGDSDLWYTAYQSRFGFSRSDLENIAMRRRRALNHRQEYIEETSAEISKFPVLLLSHDDETRDEVSFAARSGISCIEFPLSLAAADAAREMQVPFCVGTPNLLRGKSNFGNASAESLIQGGGQFILSGDYLPSSTFLALSKLSEIFTNDAAIKKFLEHAVFEPARMLASVGIVHNAQSKRKVKVEKFLAQLHGAL